MVAGRSTLSIRDLSADSARKGRFRIHHDFLQCVERPPSPKTALRFRNAPS